MSTPALAAARNGRFTIGTSPGAPRRCGKKPCGRLTVMEICFKASFCPSGPGLHRRLREALQHLSTPFRLSPVESLSFPLFRTYEDKGSAFDQGSRRRTGRFTASPGGG